MAQQPASIRYKNPGAMWGTSLAVKWGAAPKAVTLNDGKGQGNNIAVFPSYVAGICAQLDLWRSSKNYRNKRFADAIAIWSGHNEVPSYIAFCKKRVPGLTESTIMNDAFWQGPMGIPFLKAQAWHEAGKPYPAADADWIEAQRRVFAGAPAAKPITPVADTGKAAGGAVVAGTVMAGAQAGWPLWVWLALGAAAIALIVGGYFAVRWWRNRKTAAVVPPVTAAASADKLPAPAALWKAPEVVATKPKPARKPSARRKAPKKKAA